MIAPNDVENYSINWIRHSDVSEVTNDSLLSLLGKKCINII